MKENSIGDRIEEKYTRYINCETDILELTIEEAIFILETDEKVHYVEDLLQEVYKVILSDYKRVLKENEIYKKNSEIMSKENLSTAEQLKVEIKENFRLKNQLENNRKEYQETYKDVREELKELKKENEELLQEKINNQKIIVLAQNDMLNYQAGFEDGKNGRTSAVQSIIENRQYYIFQKQIEKYERHIEKLQKENEELLEVKVSTSAHNRILELEKENEKLTISNKEIDKECSRLEEKEVKLINENEHYKDLIYALKTYYDITEEDLEKCIKNDR